MDPWQPTLGRRGLAFCRPERAVEGGRVASQAPAGPILGNPRSAFLAGMEQRRRPYFPSCACRFPQRSGADWRRRAGRPAQRIARNGPTGRAVRDRQLLPRPPVPSYGVEAEALCDLGHVRFPGPGRLSRPRPTAQAQRRQHGRVTAPPGRQGCLIEAVPHLLPRSWSRRGGREAPGMRPPRASTRSEPILVVLTLEPRKRIVHLNWCGGLCRGLRPLPCSCDRTLAALG
jgi:hypothetical protein